MIYELTSNQFSGPLEKLLELVEEKKLPIKEISLAQVTDDFLKYTKKLQKEGDLPHRLLADFIVVASRLILIKSKSLLPDFELTEEEEHDIKNLEQRLLLYRAIKPAFPHIVQLLKAKCWQFGHPYFFDIPNLVFYPAKNVTIGAFSETLTRVLKEYESLVKESETIERVIISIEEKIQEVVKRLGEKIEERFSILTEAKSRTEIVALFLAILHLAREERISLEQEERFSDIMIRKLAK